MRCKMRWQGLSRTALWSLWLGSRTCWLMLARDWRQQSVSWGDWYALFNSSSVGCGRLDE